MVDAQNCMRATKKVNIFATYAIPTFQGIQKPTKLIAESKEYQNVLKKRTQIHFLSIDLMIIALILRRCAIFF